MLKTEKNKNLKSLNTFGIDIYANYYINIENTDDIIRSIEFINSNDIPFLILGGGSNILFTGNFEGAVFHINTKGISIISKKDNNVYVKAEAGENWDSLINFCVDKNLWGLENLSMIPGKVGSSPIQNIGAYGTEVKDTIEELEAYEISTGEKRIFKNNECNFGYRYSIFKAELKNKFIISSVTYKLSALPKPNISYKGLSDELKQINVKSPTIKDISNAVSRIRSNKLPDPEITGNAGSFFKNPIISSEKIKNLKSEYPNIVHFSQQDGNAKVAAAWLIEQCGWKGKSMGKAGVHDKQPLVLINNGNASSKDIITLSNKIIEDVGNKFGITLEPEVNII